MTYLTGVKIKLSSEYSKTFTKSVAESLAIEEGRLSSDAKSVSTPERTKLTDLISWRAAEELLAKLPADCTCEGFSRPEKRKLVTLKRGSTQLRIQIKGCSTVNYLGWRQKGTFGQPVLGLDFDLLILVDLGIACPVAGNYLSTNAFPNVGETVDFYLFTPKQILEVLENEERWNKEEAWIGAWRNKIPDRGSKEFRRQYADIFEAIHRNAFAAIETPLGLLK